MKQEYSAIGTYGTLGLEIALCILFGAGGGFWLDGKLNTAPWLLILGFFFGLGAAGKAVHRAWKSMLKDGEREDREQEIAANLWHKRKKDEAARGASPKPPEHDDGRE